MSDLVVTWNNDGTCTVTGDIEASSPKEAERIMRRLVAEAAFEAGIMPESIETEVSGLCRSASSSSNTVSRT